MTESIVITGAGAVTPLGVDSSTSWAALLAGKSALAADDELLAPALREYPVARSRLDDALAREEVSAVERRKLDPVALLALAAGIQAWRQAQAPESEAEETGVVLGVGYGAATTHLRSGACVHDGRVTRLSPYTLAASMPNAAAAQLAIRLGLRGSALTIGTACASGLDALGFALDTLRAGRLRRILAGGAERITDDLGVGGMAAARALARPGANGDPRVLRPFDRGHGGTAIGDGAALFVLELESSARARGAAVLGRILGYGSRSDAYHITAPDPEGRGAEAAVRAALADAHLAPSEIDAVYAHGTGTFKNDRMEGQMLARVFGPRVPPTTSIKGQCGHTMGASGALSLAFALRSIAEGLVPPTVPCDRVDVECGIEPVRGVPWRGPVERVLIDAFGFGGHDAALIVGA